MRAALIAATLMATVSSASAQTSIVGTARAIDGDSLAVSGMSVRLHGIDAPELDQICSRNGTPWRCGEEAKRHLQAIVQGQRVACRRLDTDDHGRAVSACTAGGIQINAAMVEAGWATAFRRYSATYMPHESRAKSAGVGIWSSRFDLPADYRHRNEPKQVIRMPNQSWSTAPVSAVGASPPGCAIKGNHSRKGEWIYHLPDMPYYAQTRAEAMFCSEAEAQAAGYRRSRARP